MLTHLQNPPSPPKRVVILGAHGFIARELARTLVASAIPVRAWSSAELDLSSPGAAQALAAALQPSDALVMTSCLTPDKGKDIATCMKNLRMAESVAGALAAQPCAHFVYLSSDAVYDGSEPLMSELTRPSPTDLYSMMHLARETLLTQAAATAKIPSCILRPSAVYGAGDTHNGYGPNRFIRTALAEAKIRLFGQGEETRDHVSIHDVTALIELVLRHRSIGLLNLTSGQAITFGKLAALVAQLCPGPVTIESLPRGGPVTHRHFEGMQRLRSFPEFRATPLIDGLTAMIRELKPGMTPPVR